MAKVSYKQKLKDHISSQAVGVQEYFHLLTELIDKISEPEPALAYCFQRIEMAQRVGLYCILMREYRTDSKMTWGVIDKIDIKRKDFYGRFAEFTGKSLPATLREIILPAEKVRDAITHGRSESAAEVHKAILQCLKYADALNAAFTAQVGFRPIGNLQGVTSKKGKPQLEPKISRLVLKGLDLPI